MTETQLVNKKVSWKKGEVPEHLKPFSDNLAQASRECAKEIEDKDLTGKNKVDALNACVSQKLKEMNEELKKDNKEDGGDG